MSDTGIAAPQPNYITERNATAPYLNPQATTLLTGSAATLYTAPSTTSPVGTVCRAVLYAITVANTDSSARTVTFHNVPNGGSAATGNKIVPGVSVPAATTVVLEFGAKGLPLAAAAFIQGLASVTSVVTATLTVEERA